MPVFKLLLLSIFSLLLGGLSSVTATPIQAAGATISFNPEQATVGLGETVKVQVGLDTAPRTVTAPADLLRALKAVPGALDAWQASSYTHQREHVEAIDAAKKPETRERRVAAAVAMVAAKGAAAGPGVTRRLAKKR